MKPAFLTIAAAMCLSATALGQTASPSNTVSSPGGVIGIQPPGSSSGNTGPVSLATPTRPLVSGPNSVSSGSPPRPSTTAAGTRANGGSTNQ